jgi:hypothetical protein
MAAVILALLRIGRVGSTVLGDMLNQHPSIAWGGEIYGTEWRRRHACDDPAGFAWRRAAMLPKRWYGFEVKRPHVDGIPQTLGELVAGYRAGGPVRFIVLRRENTFRKIASTAVARATGRLHLFGPTTAPRTHDFPVRVRINPQAHFIDGELRPLVDFLERFDRFHASLDELPAADASLRLSYETDLLGDPQRAYRAACRRLDSRRFRSPCVLRARSPSPCAR